MSAGMLPEGVLLAYLKKYEADADMAQRAGDNKTAAQCLRQAAGVLYQIAEQKPGAVKSATQQRANGLLAIADTLDEAGNAPAQAPVTPQGGSAFDPGRFGRPQGEAPFGSKPSSSDKSDAKKGDAKKEKKERAADETETMWEAVDVPNISFADVAGLKDVKEAVMTQFIYPRQHKEVYEALGASVGGGILMYGPPGTGKTLMAKAIAHEVGAKFYQVKCSDVVSKWFGEAEKNIKNLFEKAREDKEAVIFFDEFESIAAKRGGDDKVMSRLVPELLAQIQGFNNGDSTLLLMAATNRPWDIDSAFLRPGRFNDLLYIPLPDEPARMYIVHKLFKNTPMEQDVDIEKFGAYTEGFNGADVENFCNKIKQIAAKRVINNNLKTVVVTKEDVAEARRTVKSSVAQEDIQLIKKFEKDMKRN